MGEIKRRKRFVPYAGPHPDLLMRLLLLALVLVLPAIALAQPAQEAIPTVEKMPNLPQPYVLRDWKKVARDFDTFAFDFKKTGPNLPLIWWDDARVDHDLTGFGLPAYVGDFRQIAARNNYDAITCLGAVLGATAIGIDKSNQDGRNWVGMLKIYFSQKNGTNLYMNNPGAKTGHSFWYELLPSLVFYQIYDHYRSDPVMKQEFLAIADRWQQGIQALGTPTPNFDHTSLDLLTGQPFDNPRWREPDAAAAVAWLEYMAYADTKAQKYLQASQAAMSFLAARGPNPFYECLMPYGAYLSARMNAEQGTAYPTAKFINWIFDGSNPRQWGVIAEKWGEVEAFGLQGSVHDGSEYAFTMNTFLAPSIMAPIARYDTRFARALGKWVLNVAVNSRYFYANAWKPEDQTSWTWASQNDPQFCIAYEGIRKHGLARNRPADFQTRTAADGALERFGKIDVPAGEKGTFVVEMKPTDGVAKIATEVFTATSENGPWQPAFQFKPGDKNRKWMAWKQSGPMWVSLRTPQGAKGKPAVIDDVFVESRIARSPYLSGDPIFQQWGSTDLGLYGSAFVGLFAAMVEPTNVEGILRIDCRATESYAAPSYPTYLLYNPHFTAKAVTLPVGAAAIDLYDAAQHRFITHGIKGNAPVALAADSAAVLVLCPAGGKISRDGKRTLSNGVVIDYATP